MTPHVIQYSGGIASWCAAQRVAAQHGTENTVLLFADTQIEDDDVYTFLREGARLLGVPLVEVADGRDPWQVFEDRQFLGNSRLAPCSYFLKIMPCREWLTANADPAQTVLHIGIDPSVSDIKRVPGIVHGWLPWRAEFPLLAEPTLTKAAMLAEAHTWGLTTPKAYELGFAHANCGQLCVRGGQKHWLRTLKHFPDRYADYETREQAFRVRTGKNVAILKETRQGVVYPLTLAELRRRHEAQTRANT